MCTKNFIGKYHKKLFAFLSVTSLTVSVFNIITLDFSDNISMQQIIARVICIKPIHIFFFRSTYVTTRLINSVYGKRFLVMLRKRIKVSVWNNEECRKPYIIVYWRNMTSLLSRIKFEISYLFVVFSFPGIRIIAKHVGQLLFRVVSKYQMTKWFYK